MKNLALVCILLACIGLQSCKDKAIEKDNKATSDKIEELITKQCYTAIYEKDSVDLKINTLKNGKISGNMVMKFFNIPEKHGKILGAFQGDTLFVDYEFTEATNNKKVFKNPMAFLKRGNELVLGNGKIETYLGKSYFVKGTPIDFESVKFKFTKIDCLD